MTLMWIFFTGIALGLALYLLSYFSRLPFVMALGAALCLASLSVLAAPEPWQLQETRYCGAPARNADGSIKRSTAVLNAFKRIHPCPSTGLTTGACPGWAIDHVVSLACGSCDAVYNMQWLPDEIKSCSQPWCKDRWERKVYDSAPDIEDTSACANTIVTWPKP